MESNIHLIKQSSFSGASSIQYWFQNHEIAVFFLEDTEHVSELRLRFVFSAILGAGGGPNSAILAELLLSKLSYDLWTDIIYHPVFT